MRLLVIPDPAANLAGRAFDDKLRVGGNSDGCKALALLVAERRAAMIAWSSALLLV